MKIGRDGIDIGGKFHDFRELAATHGELDRRIVFNANDMYDIAGGTVVFANSGAVGQTLRGTTETDSKGMLTVVPRDYESGGRIYFTWTALTISSGNVRTTIDVALVADGAAVGTATQTGLEYIQSQPSTTQFRKTSATVTLSAGTISAIAPGKLLSMVIRRNGAHASDTNNNFQYILNVVFEYNY